VIRLRGGQIPDRVPVAAQALLASFQPPCGHAVTFRAPQAFDALAVDLPTLSTQPRLDHPIAIPGMPIGELVHRLHQPHLVVAGNALVALRRSMLTHHLARPALRDLVPGALDSARQRDVAPGSPFSLLQVLQHRDIQRLLGDDLVQTRVLLLKSLQALRLVLFQRPILDAPTEERLIGDLRRLQT
jgi:hypothetical protein